MNIEWVRHNFPFPFLQARRVFPQNQYNELADAVKGLIDGGTMQRSMAGYDALGCGITPTSPSPLPMFCDVPWRDWQSNLFNVSLTPYVSAGIHHHLTGSKSGFIHNDFNPVWFPKATSDIQIAREDICTYKFGDGTLADSEKIRVVRGVVMIFYLLNDNWKIGDGGATGLYTSKNSPVRQPVQRCRPVNNSMIMFECTPNSWHTFLSNIVAPRTSIIMWTHRPYDEAISIYGEENLEQWKK